MVTDLPQSFLLLGDINPKCRVLINSFANRRGERRWLINNYGRGTIHISLNKRVIQGGWVEDEPERAVRAKRTQRTKARLNSAIFTVRV